MLQILYFSRSGNCKRIANKIAEQLSTKAVEISDSVDWSGAQGYLRFIYYKLRGKNSGFQVPSGITLSDQNRYIIVSPIWAGEAALPIKALLASLDPQKVYLLTSDKSGYCKIPDHFLYKQQLTEKSGNEDKVIADLVQRVLSDTHESDNL